MTKDLQERSSLETSTRATLVGLIAPMVVSLLFIGSTAVVDSLFVSMLGKEPLTAFGFAGPITTLLYQVFVAFGVGVTSVIARAFGAGDVLGARRLTLHSGVLGMVCTAGLAAVLFITLDAVLGLMGAGPELGPMVREFMEPWALGMPFFFLVVWATAAMRGIGNTKVSALVFMLQTAVNTAAVPVFTFGLGPVPAYGFRGVAYGTVVSYAVASLLALALLRRARALAPFKQLRDAFGVSARAVAQISVPALLTFMLAPATNGVVTALLARHEIEAVAAFGVVARTFDGFLAMVPLAIASGLGPFVGQRWAAGRFADVREGVGFCRRAAFVWGAACYLIVAAAAAPLAEAFADDPRLVPTLTVAFRVVPLGFASYSLLLVANSVYNGIGQAGRSAFLALLRTVGLCIPLALIADRFLGAHWMFAAPALASILAELLGARWLARDGLRGTPTVEGPTVGDAVASPERA